MDDHHHNDAHEQNHSHEHESNSNNHGNMGNDFKEHFDGAMGTFKEIKNPGKFDVKKEFMNAIEILKLNEKKMVEVANNKSATMPALIFIALGTIAPIIGMYFMYSFMNPDIVHVLLAAVVQMVSAILGIFAINFVANSMFKAKGNFGQLFRVMGYSFIIGIPYVLVAVLPYSVSGLLSFVLIILGIVVSFKILFAIKKMSAVQVIVSGLISGLVVGILIMALNNVLGLGYGYGSFGGYGRSYDEIETVDEALDAWRDLVR